MIFAVPGDGIVRTLNPINGDAAATPVKMLPPNSAGSSLIQADGIVYAVTANGCGSAPDAVWAMDWSNDAKPIVSWKSDGAPVAGPAFAADGTLYLATGDGTSAYANSVVALDGKTLQLKDWFTAPGARFSGSPIVIADGNTTYVAAAAGDGHLYLLSAATLGGADHKTPLASAAVGASGTEGNSVATWRDSAGVRWLLAASHDASDKGAVTAFKVTGNSVPSLERAWVSRELVSPRAPIIVNGVVFALSGGSRSTPAALYALHPATGKEIWSSGNTITSFATGGLSAGTAQVYVVTYDNTVWAFGIPQAY